VAHRVERVNSLIRQEISELLQYHVKDPRLGNFIAVTEVSTSPDLKFAKVYVSQMSHQEEKQKVLKGLSSASGYFRKELSKRLKLRHVPVLSFQWDDSIEKGDNLLRLIDEIIPKDSS